MGQITLNDALKSGCIKLEKISESPKFESETLLMYALDLNRTQIFMQKERELSLEEAKTFNMLINRRLSGEPLQYILGSWEFYSLPFKVGKGVLIPRADTEILVDCGLEFLKNKKNPDVIDLCSGSGCIAVAIASERHDSSVTAVELSDSAYGYLKENIKLNNVSNIKPIKADVLLGGRDFCQYDLIVSNPPYIKTEEIDTLCAEVKNEPKKALDGGQDGLVFYRAICKLWLNNLKPDGSLMVEIGYDQKEEVSGIFSQYFKNVNCVSDLCGNNRVVIGTNYINSERKSENGR